MADILASQQPGGTLYHYVVQRAGSSAILDWGQSHSLEGARMAADESILWFHERSSTA